MPPQSDLLYWPDCTLYYYLDLWTQVGIGFASCQAASAHHLPFEVWSRGLGWVLCGGKGVAQTPSTFERRLPAAVSLLYSGLYLGQCQWTWMTNLGGILNSFVFSPPSHVRAGYFTKLTVSPLMWLNLVRDNQIQPNQPLNHQATQLKPLNCLALQAQAVLICFYELPWKYVLWPLQIMQMQMTCAFDCFLAKIFYCSKVAQGLREERFAFITICLDWHVCPTLPIKSSSNAVYLSALLAP